MKFIKWDKATAMLVMDEEESKVVEAALERVELRMVDEFGEESMSQIKEAEEGKLSFPSPKMEDRFAALLQEECQL
jgi:hypothetical protein